MNESTLGNGHENKGYQNDEPYPLNYNAKTIEGDGQSGPSSNSYLPIILDPSELENEAKKPVTIWKSNEQAPKAPERDVWDSPLEFLLSCISMSVGLGNVWRFPFTALSNGGGAFLIPYLIVLLLIGRPIYYLEMCMGQFGRFGQVKAWNMCPLFKGVGYGAMIGTICVVSYYCTIMGITVFYFFASFAKNLPWDYCDRFWDWEPELKDMCQYDGKLNQSFVNNSTKTIAAYYYTLKVFPQKDDISDGLGAPDWKLTLCLLASWILIFLSLWKGVKSSGKVAYFTAIFPYVVLIVLLIRGVTLSGAWEGIKFFIDPKWKDILKPKVWYAAVGQCFFSLSTGFGPIIMFSSYNPFRHNVYRDALVISFMDTFTSILAGCTIFAVLGHLSHETGKSIENVTEAGPGLAFVSYPEAIAKFDFVPQLFAVLFFLMLFTLGIGSATSLTGGVITIICDEFKAWGRWQVTLIVCILGFLSGLMYVTPGGPPMVDFVDFFGANFVIYVMAMVEVAGIAWGYGLNNFCADIEFMLGRKVGWYWKTCWGFIIPVGLFGILVYAMATLKPLKYNDALYPPEAIACGWTFAGLALMLIPGFALHAILTRKTFGFINKLKMSLLPTEEWGPTDPVIRAEWKQFRQEKGLPVPSEGGC